MDGSETRAGSRPWLDGIAFDLNHYGVQSNA